MLKVIQIGNLVKTKNRDNPQRGRIYSSLGLCPSIYLYQGGGLQPLFIERRDNGKLVVY